MIEKKTLADRFRSFDVYKQLPKGYLQPTVIGAIRKYFIWIFNGIFSHNYDYNNVNLFIHV